MTNGAVIVINLFKIRQFLMQRRHFFYRRHFQRIRGLALQIAAFQYDQNQSKFVHLKVFPHMKATL